MESSQKKIDKIQCIFDKYSKHEKGSLTLEEFILLVHDLRLSIPDQSIEVLYNELDTKKQGKVPYDAFTQMILQRKIPEVQLNNIISSPSTKIIGLIKKIKGTLKSEKEKAELEWAISKIKEKKIYDCIFEEEEEENVHSSEKAENDIVGWLNEYSNRKDKKAKISDLFAIQQIEKQKDKISSESPLRPILTELLDKHTKQLKVLDSIDFDAFLLVDTIGRDLTLPLVSFYILNSHSVLQQFDQQKMANFINQIYIGYKKDTPYHTDIHASDVTQNCHAMLTHGKLKEICGLSNHEVLAFLIASIIHDYKHMGLTNAFHENKRSELSVRYNDVSILENYHIAQAFKELQKDTMNIFEKLRPEEYRLIRKIIIHCVLCTDMQKHATLMTLLKNLIVTNEIKQGANNTKIIDHTNAVKQFESKKDILGICLHAADVSNSTRNFPTCQKWTMRLMEEFWKQGDMEKQLGLPISFLCDRKTVNVPSSQVGFINGITKPMFNLMVDIMPSLNCLVDSLCQNELNWRMLQINEKLQKIDSKQKDTKNEESPKTKKRYSLQEILPKVI